MDVPAITMTPAHDADCSFDALAQQVRDHFAAMFAEYGPHLFFTDGAEQIWSGYLSGFEGTGDKQHHNCSACRRFISEHGRLVFITTSGQLVSAMWPCAGTVPELFKEPLRMMKSAALTGRVISPYFSNERTWGTPQTGEWSHFAVLNPSPQIWKGVLTPGQAMAEKRKHFGTLSRALAEFKPGALAQVRNLLESEALYRGDRFMAPAKFLHDLQEQMAALPPSAGRYAKQNLIWRAVAGAPAGFCAPRSGVIGTLVEDVLAGMPFDVIKKRFDAKMRPDVYQRPQAPATAANIQQAEDIIEKLGLTSALRRRYARIEDIQTIWRPMAAEPAPAATGGVFSHLKPREASPVVLGGTDGTARAITWAKFSASVLPEALEISLMLPASFSSIGAMLTAADPDAGRILQWDREDARNPVSWYLYQSGSLPSQWGLKGGVWLNVPAIALQPNMWNSEDGGPHGAGVMFLIEGAKDARDGGLGLFPEIVRSELHGVRRTLEQFNATVHPEGKEEGNVAGVIFGRNSADERIVYRVRTKLGTSLYRLDRWD